MRHVGAVKESGKVEGKEEGLGEGAVEVATGAPVPESHVRENFP